MKNTFGDALTITLFGESHGSAIGAVIDGIAPGIAVDCDYISHRLDLRRPYGVISTARREADEYEIVSGVSGGKTTGTPICILIPNADTHSSDYSAIDGVARPSHADYSAFAKYHGFEDRRGGGHFSGRLTAPIVAAGAILLDALAKKGILIGTHLSRCAGIADREFGDYADDITTLDDIAFPVLDTDAGEAMNKAIIEAKADGDSVGGVLETAVIGLPAGVGEPFFDSLESKISHAVFSVGGVKGIEFGDGFALADMRGSESNDPMHYDGGELVFDKNSMGGVNGGISNGAPIIFRTAVKPTPSIATEQDTVNFETGENVSIAIAGRHDPCIAHRARAVVDSLTAFVIADMLTVRFGTDYLS